MELAVFADCRTLIRNFVKKSNPKFHSFCVQWKAMMFQHLYAAQSTNIELIQTTEAALYIAKRTVCDEGGESQLELSSTRLRRIGGMYLMYTIYFKQPTEKFIKINLNLESWKQLTAFINELPMTEMFDDVRFIFWKLYEDNAFHFTALDYYVGLEDLIDYDHVNDHGVMVTQSGTRADSSRLMQELEVISDTQQIIPALSVLEDGYNEMKEMLANKAEVDSRALPQTTIFKDIEKAFANIQEMLTVHPSDKHNCAQTRSDIDRRNLKRKGYKVTHTKGDIQIDRTEDCKATTSNASYQRRMSARTIFSGELPQEIVNDLEKDESTETSDCENVDYEAEDISSHLQDNEDVEELQTASIDRDIANDINNLLQESNNSD